MDGGREGEKEAEGIMMGRVEGEMEEGKRKEGEVREK